MTPDEAALLNAIRANPEDDVPRLVYADWLEENAGEVPCEQCEGLGEHPKFLRPNGWDSGRCRAPNATDDCPTCHGSGTASDGRKERAEFIRVQCEIASRAGVAGERDAALWERERELWRQIEPWTFIRGMPTDWTLTTFAKGTAFRVGPHEGHPLDIRCDVRRGFVEKLSGPLAAFWEERECDNCGGEGRVETGMRENSYGPCPDCGGRFETRDDEFDLGYSFGTGHVSGPTAAFAELVKREPVARVEVSDFGDEWTICVAGSFHDLSGYYRVSQGLFDFLEPSELGGSLGGGYGGRQTHWTYPASKDARAALSSALLAGARGTEGCGSTAP